MSEDKIIQHLRTVSTIQTGQIGSLLLDFRLDKFPTFKEMDSNFVQIIQDTIDITVNKVYDKENSDGMVRTACFESTNPGHRLFMIIRAYQRDRISEKVRLTITMEMPGETWSLFQAGFDDILDDILVENILKVNRDSESLEGSTFPIIKRCIPTLSPYFRTSDERIIEYGFIECVFRERSSFQLIEIMKTIDFGKVLILDGLVNLAESDTEAYTHSLMNLPNEDYKDKEVLILGGGDGGLLKELLELQHPPKFVTMVEIDQIVMEACDKHMNKVCGPYLREDNRHGARHKIITGCAIEFMNEAIKSEQHYDYVFGDLTDVPMSSADRSKSLWTFMESILSTGTQLIKPQLGKFMTHCNGRNVPKAAEAFENVLSNLHDGKCSFEKSETFVPSFMETWLFYRIMRQ